ncbi:MAG TPA: M1 family aminopeptidase [Chloroflexota bacterium]|nr:M1 family aminopeptidase [Chloroflexota bacterium]
MNRSAVQQALVSGLLILASFSATVPPAKAATQHEQHGPMIAQPAHGAANGKCLSAVLNAQESSPTGRYTITMKPSDKRLVLIEAKVRTGGDGLLMYPEGASHVAEGWATYIRNLKAFDRQGSPILLEGSGPGAWRVPDQFRGREIGLSYEVLLHHDVGETWPFGWDEAAYVKGDAIFLTGKALFITALDMQSVRVDFDIPKKWKLVTPWLQGCDERSYHVKDTIELTESGHFIGEFTHSRVTAAGATVEIGLGKALAKSAPLIEGVLKSSLSTAARMLGPVPDQTFAVIADLEPKYSGGGTFVRSVSMLFQEPPMLANRDEWGHIVTHELLHLWLGGAVEPAAEQEYWLTEGFTDYLSNLVELRSGLITEARFWQRVREHHAKYLKQAGTVSLRDAGLQKGTYYDLVYSGGFLAALALDVEMRQSSKLAHGVPDLVRALNAEFGGRARFSPGDVARLATQLSGRDIAPFIRDYILGVKPLPIEHSLGAMGLSLNPRVKARSATSAKLDRLRNVLLRGDGN